jgi:hypothetical protein
MEHFEPNSMHSIKNHPNYLLVTRQIFCGFEAKELFFVRNNFSLRKTIARKCTLVIFPKSNGSFWQGTLFIQTCLKQLSAKCFLSATQQMTKSDLE